nr:hypothetical protein [Tanacetum cinerariifolium]
MILLIGREVDNDFKLENKFSGLCEEVTIAVKEKGEVIEELERSRGNLVAVEIVRVLNCVQKRDLEKATRLQIMVVKSYLGACEKLFFVTKTKKGLLGFPR